MKLPRFEYVRPKSLREAIELLSGTDGAKILAGGQSLLPVMAYRLASPPLLVDIGDLAELKKISVTQGGVSLGSRVRWCDIEADKRLQEAHPLLAAMISHVAHYQIRNRGTVGGSLAHADPAAEMPGFAVTCDVELVVMGAQGRRIIPAREFFLAPLETTLKPDEIIVEIHIPVWPATRRWGFEELARRRGDFAIAGIAIFYDEDAGSRISNAHVGAIGVADRPVRLTEVEHFLNGRIATEEVIEAAGRAAATAVDPPEDLHASVAYRRALAATLTERALRHAAGDNTMEAPR